MERKTICQISRKKKKKTNHKSCFSNYQQSEIQKNQILYREVNFVYISLFKSVVPNLFFTHGSLPIPILLWWTPIAIRCLKNPIVHGWVKRFEEQFVTWDNLATLDAFVEVVKIANNTRQGDSELAWYSPSATCRIFLYGSEHDPRIHGFRF